MYVTKTETETEPDPSFELPLHALRGPVVASLTFVLSSLLLSCRSIRADDQRRETEPKHAFVHETTQLGMMVTRASVTEQTS